MAKVTVLDRKVSGEGESRQVSLTLRFDYGLDIVMTWPVTVTRDHVKADVKAKYLELKPDDALLRDTLPGNEYDW